jgi:hypothetical protein
MVMSREDAQSSLDELCRAMHQQHADNAARLSQLDAHAATLAMVVDHLYDEAEKAGAE